MATNYLAQALGAISRDTSTGRRAEDEYFRRALTYDPGAAIKESATGLFNQFRKTLGREVSSLRGQQVGMGRLASGFATDDEDYLTERIAGNYSDRLMENALEGEKMRYYNNRDIGDFGGRVTERGYDMLSSERDRATAEENARKQRKASIWGGLAGMAGTVLGPVGSALGSKLGSYIK
jgi:hypothetical protein